MVIIELCRYQSNVILIEHQRNVCEKRVAFGVHGYRCHLAVSYCMIGSTGERSAVAHAWAFDDDVTKIIHFQQTVFQFSCFLALERWVAREDRRGSGNPLLPSIKIWTTTMKTCLFHQKSERALNACRINVRRPMIMVNTKWSHRTRNRRRKPRPQQPRKHRRISIRNPQKRKQIRLSQKRRKHKKEKPTKLMRRRRNNRKSASMRMSLCPIVLPPPPPRRVSSSATGHFIYWIPLSLATTASERDSGDDSDDDDEDGWEEVQSKPNEESVIQQVSITGLSHSSPALEDLTTEPGVEHNSSPFSYWKTVKRNSPRWTTVK